MSSLVQGILMSAIGFVIPDLGKILDSRVFYQRCSACGVRVPKDKQIQRGGYAWHEACGAICLDVIEDE